jgi:hypothetical protein
MQFPSDWPPGCPPEDAVDADGPVYRLVKSNPATPDDMQSHHEKQTMLNHPACLRCGLSVFRTRGDAEHQHAAYPKLGKFVASGTLRPEHGKVKQTGRPTHTTWWVYDGVDRLAVITAIEVVV